jgi:HSP20 family protein
MTALVKRNNGLSLLPELPSLFNDPFLRDWLPWNGGQEERGTLPAVNIRETDEVFELSVAAPGMKKEDFKVELDNNRLVISGETKQKNEQTHDNYLRKEYSYQSFVRSFALAEKQVSGEKIQAKYADGILHITIPKSAEAKTKPAKVIPIS